MELEVLRMMAAAAADATIGINAMIDGLPVEGADERPPHVTLYNSVEHQWVRRKSFPESGHGLTFPAVAIRLASPLQVEQVMTTVRDAQVPVMFAYLVRDAETLEGSFDALQTNRAILRFLRRLADNAGAAFRTRNGVQLINPVPSTSQGLTEQQWDKAFVAAATITTWLARETAA